MISSLVKLAFSTKDFKCLQDISLLKYHLPTNEIDSLLSVILKLLLDHRPYYIVQVFTTIQLKTIIDYGRAR